MSEFTPSLEEVLFELAAAKSNAAERAVFLDGVCRANPALRARLDELLEGHFQAEGFLGGESKKVEERPAPAPAATEDASTFIGRYKLLEKLGEGGFGEVWMAEQKEPVKRRVALKIIKLGMDTKQVVARFEAERQALALMDHPNIAKVFDAGATDTGRPYFVMELVRGERITEFCDKNQVTAPQRLNLFIQVCRAIQHAHQKGIIHRDIKPSNILVTLHDGVPVPKIIDFGIAKATQQELTEKTVFTQFRQFLGTPAYISPEQAEMSGLDIDTRSDIYSLGVLLYELLTGLTPFDTQELLKAGLEGLRKAIRENQPLRPSTRLSGMAKEELTTTAKRRGAEPPKLLSLVRGDLDWIVMNCLEKDRARRYETANGLARDVERFLHHEPIVARPPSRLYEFQKTVRRHRVGFAAVGAVLAALAAGTLISWRAERLAKERLAEAETISSFLSDVFDSASPSRGRTVTVVESLGVAARKLENELTNQPARRAGLQQAVAATYGRLGFFREAIPLQEKVRDYDVRAYGPEAPRTTGAILNLANLYTHVGRGEEALKLREQALAALRKHAGREHWRTLVAMNDLGQSYAAAGRQEEAIKLKEQALALSRKINGPEHRHTLTFMHNLGASYSEVARLPDAAKLLEEELRLCRKVEGPEHPDITLPVMITLAGVYQQQSRWPEAMKLLEEALPLSRKVHGPEHPHTQVAMNNLALSLLQVGRLEEGVKLQEDLLALRRKMNVPQDAYTLNIMWRLTQSYCWVGRSREALALLEELCRLDPKEANYALELATLQTWFGLDTEYEATRRRLVAEAELPERAAMAESASRAWCLRPSTDAVLLNKALELARKASQTYKTNAWSLLSVGLAEYRNGHFAAAGQTLPGAQQGKQGLSAWDEADGKAQQIEGIAGFFRALSLFHQGRTNEARTLFHQVEARMPPLPKDEARPLSGIDPTKQGYDFLIWWLAYKEARSDLGEPAGAPPGAPRL